MSELALLSMREVADLLATRQLSPVELTEQMLKRIADLDERFQSYVTVTADLALAQAKTAEDAIRRGDYRGPLHGIPIALKDLCYTKRGCHDLRFSHVP